MWGRERGREVRRKAGGCRGDQRASQEEQNRWTYSVLICTWQAELSVKCWLKARTLKKSNWTKAAALRCGEGSDENAASAGPVLLPEKQPPVPVHGSPGRERHAWCLTQHFRQGGKYAFHLCLPWRKRWFKLKGKKNVFDIEQAVGNPGLVWGFSKSPNRGRLLNAPIRILYASATFAAYFCPSVIVCAASKLCAISSAANQVIRGDCDQISTVN